MNYKSPKLMADNWRKSLNFPQSNQATQEDLDEEVRELFNNRPEGLEYIYDTFPQGDDRTHALERLNRVYPETRNLRERWEDYINYGVPHGSERLPELWNDEFVEIEKQLPFKDEEEHKKWSDQAATWMGEPEWLDMTEDLVTRAGFPKAKEENPQFKSKLPF